ncbi:NPC1, partial [Symbiodinium microadriaticum]
MLENRSLDHMLGFLKRLKAEVNGCLPDATGCSNHLDPQHTSSATVTVDDTAVYVQVSPHHSIDWTTTQVYGYPKDVPPPEGSLPTMDGFIAAYADNFEDYGQGSDIMKCFAPDHVPVIANLSMEYGLFDGWFASVPGPTMVNRAYASSATSHGMGTNDAVSIAKGYPQKTMFRQLTEMGLDYRVYFQDVPSVLQFKEMRRKEARSKYRWMDSLFEDLKTGDLPEFTWLEPAYFTTPTQKATDQHPDHDVSEGEQLMKDIYEALRASPIWESSVLLITYDEHGGFFDHVPPPENIPNPDGLNATDDPFDFTRLGVRVPAVVVSPWVKKGSVFHAPPPASGMAQKDGYAPSQYEHSSIVSTVIHKMFSPKEGFE